MTTLMEEVSVMPWGDRTGPFGLGPMTGRAAGFCAGFPVPGFANPVPGLGWGRGWGWRWWAGYRGFLWPYAWGYPGYGPAYDEKRTLKAWGAALRRQLEAVEKRLAELEEGR